VHVCVRDPRALYCFPPVILFYYYFIIIFFVPFFNYITYIVLWYLPRIHSFNLCDDAQVYTILIPRDALTCHMVMILSNYNIKYYCLRTKSIDLVRRLFFQFFFSTAGCSSYFLNARGPPLTIATTVRTAAENYKTVLRQQHFK